MGLGQAEQDCTLNCTYDQLFVLHCTSMASVLSTNQRGTSSLPAHILLLELRAVEKLRKWFCLDPNKIELATAFLSRCMAHTMLGTVYYCTMYMCKLFQPLDTYNQLFILHCTATWRKPGISRGLESEFILTNERPALETHLPIIILPQTQKHRNIETYIHFEYEVS
jgi:hypothetical protein